MREHNHEPGEKREATGAPDSRPMSVFWALVVEAKAGAAECLSLQVSLREHDTWLARSLKCISFTNSVELAKKVFSAWCFITLLYNMHIIMCGGIYKGKNNGMETGMQPTRRALSLLVDPSLNHR